MTDGFTEGQRIYIETASGRVEGFFVRPGEQTEGITVESPAVKGPYIRDVAWVRRSDTGEEESFKYERLSAA